MRVRQLLDLRLSEAFQAAYATFEGVELDLDPAALRDKLGGFFRDRLRGLLIADYPGDVVDAALGVAAVSYTPLTLPTTLPVVYYPAASDHII